MKKVGPTIADALGRAHDALRVDLQKLENAIRPVSGTSLAQLRRCLARTRTHVLMHFQLEEQNGYMEVIRKREPRLERPIQQLAEEHQQLAKTLDALVLQVDAAAFVGDLLREEIRTWIERIRQHEIRENEFVQEAFDLDISAED
jgi:iron-sulfur cluster repair protein YtfE (RIC family)